MHNNMRVTQEECLKSHVDPAICTGKSRGVPSCPGKPGVALLTGGGDRPYALGLASSLVSQNVAFDFIGSDEVNGPELHQSSLVHFLNLRGDQRSDAGAARKVWRVLIYYARLLWYAASARPKVFHILWNNKLEFLDRTLLLLYYRLLGKRIVLTAHNVNAGKRDGKDTLINRLTLRAQYCLADHIFVHTARMKSELVSDFAVSEEKVSVIPFGINNTVPNSALTSVEAKRQLGINSSDQTLLFFGGIAPYKGLEYLIAAFAEISSQSKSYRLVIAGKPKDRVDYWNQIQQAMARSGVRDRILERIEYVPDGQTELYFKAADVLILPYTCVFQSGVLYLGYNFGLPVIAADVGSLKEEIIEGKTGFVFRPRDSSDLAKTIRRYFASDLFTELESRRPAIKKYASQRYSWSKVATMTTKIYRDLLEA